MSSANELETCPFDEAHKVKRSRMQIHIAKCRLNHLDSPQPFVCPFNATHILPAQEKAYHLSRCPDRVVLDRTVTAPLHQNNPFKGRTAVPSVSEPIHVEPEEVWEVDDDIKPGYQPTKEVPIGAIIHPEPLSKPAVRRQLYKELHQMPSGLDIKSDGATKNIKSGAANPAAPIPRQPKQLSEAERQFEDQDPSPQYLGLGRGKPPSTRIAANIFPRQPQVNKAAPAQSNYSAVISGMKNLGLGRAVANTASPNPVVLNDDDFPALGVGRGSAKNPQRQGRGGAKNPQK
ncbi:gametocyte-specific factor 1 homolog isoform X1 [Argiope bruennichi]|uniref:gametocyte-specific factor 1 homolog isoform X1 n=1 Tax=Argiope bruennichi TaxID=94029 RepID=UPI0024940F8F|nr:gametocyte-specific factor 1 homolog isoform X1 [Argiope bruennichi]